MMKLAIKKLCNWKTLLLFSFCAIFLLFAISLLREYGIYVEEGVDPKLILHGMPLLPVVYGPDSIMLIVSIAESFYLLLLLIPFAILLHFYLHDGITTTIVRIGRQRWFTKMILLSFLFVFLVTSLYLLFILIYYQEAWKDFTIISFFCPGMLKLCTGFLTVIVFLYTTISFKNPIISVPGAILSGFLCEIFLRWILPQHFYKIPAFLWMLFLIFSGILIFFTVQKIKYKDL